VTAVPTTPAQPQRQAPPRWPTGCRGRACSSSSGRALSRAMDALEQAAADAPLHRNLGDLGCR
jgi:hypothetical protein